MELGPLGTIKPDDLFFLGTVAAVAAATSLSVFFGCVYWFRREQRRLHARILASVERGGDRIPELHGLPRSGELVAQFRSKQGKQVISVLEADGKRFLHVDGDISGAERARMVRYLKSEGFMS